MLKFLCVHRIFYREICRKFAFTIHSMNIELALHLYELEAGDIISPISKSITMKYENVIHRKKMRWNERKNERIYWKYYHKWLKLKWLKMLLDCSQLVESELNFKTAKLFLSTWHFAYFFFFCFFVSPSDMRGSDRYKVIIKFSSGFQLS